MNALELADELKEISLIADNHTKIVLGIAETMLRQQEVEIERITSKYEEILHEQQQRLTKYELRHVVQRDRIAILEAQLKKAGEK